MSTRAKRVPLNNLIEKKNKAAQEMIILVIKITIKNDKCINQTQNTDILRKETFFHFSYYLE